MSKWDVSKTAEEVEEDISRRCANYEDLNQSRSSKKNSTSILDEDDDDVKIVRPPSAGDIVAGVAIVGVMAYMWFSAK